MLLMYRVMVVKLCRSSNSSPNSCERRVEDGWMVRESGKRRIWQEGGKYADRGPKEEERE